MLLQVDSPEPGQKPLQPQVSSTLQELQLGTVSVSDPFQHIWDRMLTDPLINIVGLQRDILIILL